MSRWILIAAGLVLLLLLTFGGALRSTPSLLLAEITPNEIAADGFSSARLILRASNGRALSAADVQLEIVEGNRRARIESIRGAENGSLLAVVRAGVLPGSVVIEAGAKELAPARVKIETRLSLSDRYADGTPDFLRLDSEADRNAFRRWFTFLAEAQVLRANRLPAEINDCAGLVRFAYREALSEHTGEWAAGLALPFPPGGGSVRKYQYPFTPLGAGLFRIKPSAFSGADDAKEAFAQFADAQSLRRWNTHFISRDVFRAQSGDLLFYRQLEQDLPFHVMIFLGPSQMEKDLPAGGNISGRWVIYHTGPFGGGKGEIRRVRLTELLRHPQPRWRPLPGNANFLGVYRWNILREGE